MQSRIKYGMVGGGEGAFIGEIHRMAARLDNHYELVAGAFSSEAERSIRSAKTLGISADRSYADFQEMAKKEQARTDGIEAVVIVTPNHLHLRIAEIFLQAGIHVICDKPLSATLEEGHAFAEFARKSDKIFALTYNYSGYPMVRHARALIAQGQLVIFGLYKSNMHRTGCPKNWKILDINKPPGARILNRAVRVDCLVT